jgi:hypothetical protein
VGNCQLAVCLYQKIINKHNFIGISTNVCKMSAKFFCLEGFVSVFDALMDYNKIQEDCAQQQ